MARISSSQDGQFGIGKGTTAQLSKATYGRRGGWVGGQGCVFDQLMAFSVCFALCSFPLFCWFSAPLLGLFSKGSCLPVVCLLSFVTYNLSRDGKTWFQGMALISSHPDGNSETQDWGEWGIGYYSVAICSGSFIFYSKPWMHLQSMFHGLPTVLNLDITVQYLSARFFLSLCHCHRLSSRTDDSL